jgi:probable H4MPT-linked C1 transfer pathway protein
VKTASALEYLPMWKYPNKLKFTLRKLAKKVAKTSDPEIIIVTMTAELVDSYKTKAEGVNQILNQVEDVFRGAKTLVVDVEGRLRTIAQARCEPIRVAAANWAATGWLVAQLKRDCIVIDVGSTTTSIIPIRDGTVVAEGKSDFEKLILGELVYTGSLRTNVAAIVDKIPMEKGAARVSSELFAQSADVHLILGNISTEDYTVETADSREKTREASLARLARIVCADTDTLTEGEIVQIAKYVYAEQLAQIAQALNQVCNRQKNKKMTAVVTGLGRNFLARKAAEQAAFDEITDFGELINGDIAKISTAFAAALMGASNVQGGLCIECSN